MSEVAWSARAKLARWIALSAYLCLIVQQLADSWVHGMPLWMWAVRLLPLLLFLPGMLRDRLRSYLWLCFVCLLYFITLVERIFAVPDSLLAMLGLAAVVILFIAAMLYVRWRARELRQQQTAGDAQEVAE